MKKTILTGLTRLTGLETNSEEAVSSIRSTIQPTWSERLADAFALLFCRGRVVLTQVCVVGQPHDPASCDHSDAPALRTPRMLECTLPSAKCIRCPRFKAFRQIPNEFSGDVFFFSAERNEDLADRDFKPAEIDYLNTQFSARFRTDPPTQRDFEVHAILPKRVNCINHAKHRTASRNAQSESLDPGHAPETNVRIPEGSV